MDTVRFFIEDFYMNIKDIFCFDKFITPAFISIIYWISIVVSVLSGLGAIISSFRPYGGVGLFITGLIIIVGGIILSRVMCELTLVVFKIHENLKKIADAKELTVVEKE